MKPEGQIHHVPANACPNCGAKLDAMHGLVGEPEPGSLTVCFYCAQCMQLDDDLNIQALTVEELEALLVRQPRELRAIRRSRAQIIARRPS